MILDVTEKYHDYEDLEYLLDTDKLNPNNYVDSVILKKVKTQKLKHTISIDATNWETDPKFGQTEPMVTQSAKVKNMKPTAVLNLKIWFDC